VIHLSTALVELLFSTPDRLDTMNPKYRGHLLPGQIPPIERKSLDIKFAQFINRALCGAPESTVSMCGVSHSAGAPFSDRAALSPAPGQYQYTAVSEQSGLPCAWTAQDRPCPRNGGVVCPASIPRDAGLSRAARHGGRRRSGGAASAGSLQSTEYASAGPLGVLHV
jgi:hypothetical protein